MPIDRTEILFGLSPFVNYSVVKIAALGVQIGFAWPCFAMRNAILRLESAPRTVARRVTSANATG
jgi:hypothetical protein